MAGGTVERLRRRREFKSVYANGVKVVGRYVVLFVWTHGEERSRFGVTATRRIGGAVERNRARRRLRELARRHRERIDGLVADIVVNVRRGCQDVAWAELEADYLRCLSRVESRLPERAPS